MEQLTTCIAVIALFVTTINVILVFIDYCRRFGIKLNCLFLNEIETKGNTIEYKSFPLLVNNLKSNNLCIIQISCIILNKDNKLEECILFPSIKNKDILLLSSYEAKIIPTDDFFATKLFLTNKEKRLYFRIKTSKGLFFIDLRQLPWWKKYTLFYKKISKFEKQLQQQEYGTH